MIKKLKFLLAIFCIVLLGKRHLFASEEPVLFRQELILDLDKEQPQYLYSEPQIIYDVEENPLYFLNREKQKRRGPDTPQDAYGVQDEHPRYLYSNPQVIYKYRENPLFNLNKYNQPAQTEKPRSRKESKLLHKEEARQKTFAQENSKENEKHQELQRKYCELKYSFDHEVQLLRNQIECLNDQLSEMSYFEIVPEYYEQSPQEQVICEPTQPIHCIQKVPYFSNPEIYAAALYWSPTYGGVHYATLAPQPTQAKEVFASHNWGYNVEAMINFYQDRMYLHGEYYNFHQSSIASVSSPGNIIPVFAPTLADNYDFGSGAIDSTYIAAGITYQYQWHRSPRWASRVLAGFRYIRIKEKERYLYLDPGEVAPAFQRFNLKGWGPRVGAEFSVFPFCNYKYLSSLEVSGQLGMLVLLSKSKLLLVTIPTGVLGSIGTVDFPETSTTVEGLDFKLEVIYPLYFSCCNIKIHGGYELHSYQDARERIGTTNTLGVSPETQMHLGYGGPFIALSVDY